jgi:hypothetical protein
LGKNLQKAVVKAKGRSVGRQGPKKPLRLATVSTFRKLSGILERSLFARQRREDKGGSLAEEE